MTEAQVDFNRAASLVDNLLAKTRKAKTPAEEFAALSALVDALRDLAVDAEKYAYFVRRKAVD